MTISEQLREHALRHAPSTDAGAICEWTGCFRHVYPFCEEVRSRETKGFCYDFRYGTSDEKRMFLLFVAEALES